MVDKLSLIFREGGWKTGEECLFVNRLHITQGFNVGQNWNSLSERWKRTHTSKLNHDLWLVEFSQISADNSHCWSETSKWLIDCTIIATALSDLDSIGLIYQGISGKPWVGALGLKSSMGIGWLMVKSQNSNISHQYKELVTKLDKKRKGQEHDKRTRGGTFSILWGKQMLSHTNCHFQVA